MRPDGPHPPLKAPAAPADEWGIGRLLVITFAAAALGSAVAGSAVAANVAGQTKVEAQIHVLAIVARSWAPRRIPELVDPATRLPRANTQAVCTGHGRATRGRYARFVCVIRPLRHRRRQGLYVTYRVLPDGAAAVHWLMYVRR